MQKIVLISLYGVENMGIRSLASFLRREGVETYLIFFKRWINNDIRPPSRKEEDALIGLLRELDADIAGFSFTAPFFSMCAGITRRIKDTLPVQVVWGGMHATSCPDDCLAYCDAVCIGEGEHAALELARSGTRKHPEFRGIRNIRGKGQPRESYAGIRPLIPDLDSLPYPEYGGERAFFIDGGMPSRIDPAVFSRELRVCASRGCPFNCSYCYNSALRKLYGDRGYHRVKSVETVISEIEHSLSRLKRVRKIKFDDDTFVFPPAWLDEFCRKYRKRVGLPFEILLNAECAGGGALKKLKSAGLRKVQVGIQSLAGTGDRGIYHRRISRENIRNFALEAAGEGVAVVYDVIMDNPAEDAPAQESLIDFLLELPRPFDLFMYSLTVFPGTALCEEFLRAGIIKPEDVEGHARKSFRQFRLSFGYPRGRKDLRAACLVSLTSKVFVPVWFLKALQRSVFLRRHPVFLRFFAETCNNLKLCRIFLEMFFRGEAGAWKLREYGSPRRFLIQ